MIAEAVRIFLVIHFRAETNNNNNKKKKKENKKKSH